MVEGEGFEPSKTESADLQSAPFDRSGTPPVNERGIRVTNTAKILHQLIFFGKKYSMD